MKVCNQWKYGHKKSTLILPGNVYFSVIILPKKITPQHPSCNWFLPRSWSRNLLFYQWNIQRFLGVFFVQIQKTTNTVSKRRRLSDFHFDFLTVRSEQSRLRLPYDEGTLSLPTWITPLLLRCYHLLLTPGLQSVLFCVWVTAAATSRRKDQAVSWQTVAAPPLFCCSDTSMFYIHGEKNWKNTELWLEVCCDRSDSSYHPSILTHDFTCTRLPAVWFTFFRSLVLQPSTGIHVEIIAPCCDSRESARPIVAGWYFFQAFLF